ncbi:unnamed protein product [Fusarium langsethiae]|nr:unnamed protein product [Fusarium langsethiae]
MSLIPTKRVNIDPEGDTLIILAITQTFPAPGSIDSSETVTVKTGEKSFLCSKKHLNFASRRAARVFSSNFKESSKQNDGLYHWNFGSAFNPEAFQIVLNVIHGKSRAVPQNLGPDILADIASIVDDLECSDIVPSFDLPIRADIIKRIEDCRKSILQDLVDRLNKLQDDLLEGKLGCSHGCRAMLLGALLQAMKASKLYPPPQPPFSSLTLGSVIESLRNAQSPRYFSASGDGPARKASGSWHIQEQPSAPPAPPVKPTLFGSRPSSNPFHYQNKPVPRPNLGDFFGASPVRQSPPATNTASTGYFNTRPEPRNGGFTPGGLFGSPAVPQANTIIAPRTTSGGLYSGATTPRTTSPPRPSGGGAGTEAASQSQTSEVNDAPQKITRHDCRLKDLIDPLILAVEEKIQGLPLADFPRL